MLAKKKITEEEEEEEEELINETGKVHMVWPQPVGFCLC